MTDGEKGGTPPKFPHPFTPTPLPTPALGALKAFYLIISVCFNFKANPPPPFVPLFSIAVQVSTVPCLAQPLPLNPDSTFQKLPVRMFLSLALV